MVASEPFTLGRLMDRRTLDRDTLVRAAIGVMVGAFILILVIGLRPVTGFPDLSAQGGYQGLVAYSTRGLDSCLHVVDLATGDDTRDPVCAEWVSIESFKADGVFIHHPDGFHVLPVRGGEPIPVGEDEFRRAAEPLPDSAFGHLEGGRTTELVIDGVSILEVRGPGGYGIDHYAISPDGEFVLVFDSVQRMIVARTDGTGRPMALPDRAFHALWQQPA